MNEPGISIPQEGQPIPQAFMSFALEQGANKENVDENNRFLIKHLNRSKKISRRRYFAVNPSGGFDAIAGVGVNADGFISLNKFGRVVPTKYGTNIRETESISFHTEGTKSVDYSLLAIKGKLDYDASVNSLSIKFNEEGEFVNFSSRGEDGDNPIHFHIKREELEEHFGRSKDPCDFTSETGVRIFCEDDGDSYIMYLIAADAKPQHKVIVKKKIDNAEDLMEDLGVKSLMENPLQPAHGIEGKSHGDDLWRYANLSDIMGVQVTPIDTPEELEEFDKKGFRALVASIANQV